MAHTRQRIIAATNEVFRRAGYNGASLKQISAAADATIGSIYHFFPGGKEELGVAVVESTGAVYRELFLAIVAEHDDPAAGFEAFFAGAAAVLEESDYLDPCPIGTIAREVANTSEPLRLAAAAAFASWIDAAAGHLRSAGVAAEQAGSLAHVFVAMVEGGFVLSRTQRSPAALIAAGSHAAMLVGRAVRGAAPASV